MFFAAGGDDDFEDPFALDDFEIIPMQEIGKPPDGALEVEDNDLVLCCCQKDMPHDESMKFRLKIAKGYDNSILNEKLFEDRLGQRGELVQLHENKEQINNILTLVDRKMI